MSDEMPSQANSPKPQKYATINITPVFEEVERFRQSLGQGNRRRLMPSRNAAVEYLICLGLSEHLKNKDQQTAA